MERISCLNGNEEQTIWIEKNGKFERTDTLSNIVLKAMKILSENHSIQETECELKLYTTTWDCLGTTLTMYFTPAKWSDCNDDSYEGASRQRITCGQVYYRTIEFWADEDEFSDEYYMNCYGDSC